ncbi:MAG: WG repeat-containing protein [Candidatus Riflebacteria bacterium]|nr:WG repeat-containing protein [Candidatus Riflebacteria bacterium]
MKNLFRFLILLIGIIGIFITTAMMFSPVLRKYTGFAFLKLFINPTVGKWGFIDPSGKIVIPTKFSAVGKFSDGLAAFGVINGKNYLWGAMDRTGKIILEAKFYKLSVFSSGLAAVKFRDKNSDLASAFVDKTGRIILEGKYSDTRTFSDGMAPVIKNDTWGYINPQGEEVIPCQYSAVAPFSNGFAIVKTGTDRPTSSEKHT